jgi:hypothetical protein
MFRVFAQKRCIYWVFFGMKLEIRLIFGIIIQFFVCNGSEFRARWNKGIKIHVEQGNSYQNVDFVKIVGCFQENFQEHVTIKNRMISPFQLYDGAFLTKLYIV